MPHDARADAKIFEQKFMQMETVGGFSLMAALVLAMFIPLNSIDGGKSLVERLEHDLHHGVAFIILPIFAFANAGIYLTGLKAVDLLEPVPLGIALGLLLGKQLEIFGIIWLSVKAGIAKLPTMLDGYRFTVYRFCVASALP